MIALLGLAVAFLAAVGTLLAAVNGSHATEQKLDAINTSLREIAAAIYETRNDQGLSHDPH